MGNNDITAKKYLLIFSYVSKNAVILIFQHQQ